MKLRNLFIVNAVISFVFGIATVLVPTMLLSLYGITLSEAGIVVTRLYGAALLSHCLLTWLARDVPHSEARRAIVPALFVSDIIGFIVGLLGQLAGVANPLGWSVPVIYVLLALGYGYFQFVKPPAS